MRLVIPIRVVEELDLNKWGDNKRLAERARNVLPVVQRVLGPGGAPGKLRDDVTIEVPIPARPRHRPTDADEEILATCEDLIAFSGRIAKLVTGDASLSIRAEASGITVIAMPDRFERKETTASARADR